MLVAAGRCPKNSETTLDILQEESIQVYLIYYDQLKKLFTQFLVENFNDRISNEKVSVRA